MKDLEGLIAAAAGRSPADILIRGAKVLNVFTKEFLRQDIAVYGSYIAGIGESGLYKARDELDFTGSYIVPGFIDAHVHIESSMLLPQEFARIIASRGTTAVIADSHEIANVLGADGVRFMSRQSEKADCDIYFMVPSCVPAADFEHTGGIISADDIENLLRLPRVLGLGEMMNYPGIISANPDVLAKIKRASQRMIDGHAPLLTGKDLQAYRSAGIRTDHECRSFDEALEKLSLGMWILLREGSSARDLEHIVPELLKAGIEFNRLAFCTDDKNAADILKEGHIDHSIRTAIDLGMSPETAYCMASIQAAECYGLKDRGALCAGYKADFVVLDDPVSVKIQAVYKGGKKIETAFDSNLKKSAEQSFGNAAVNLSYTENAALMERACNSVFLPEITEAMFTFGPADSNIEADRHVIRIRAQTLNTESVLVAAGDIKAGLASGRFCRAAMLERHQLSGLSGLCLLEGYGLNKGAIASSVGHDAHNIICAGANPSDMKTAVEYLKKVQGGLCIALNGKITAALNLRVAGLMSAEGAESAVKDLRLLEVQAKKLGIYDTIEPFVTLSFLGLPVIPALRITEQGLFDVIQWRHICQ